jgi:NADP-dependent aldehyde dehydrogenase
MPSAVKITQICTDYFLALFHNHSSNKAEVKAKAEKEIATDGTNHPINTESEPGKRGPQDIAEAVGTIKENGAAVVVGGEIAEGPGYAFQNTLLRVSGEDFIKNPHALQTEAFGPVSLMIFADDIEQMKDITRSLEGNLTGCIYSDTRGSDDALYAELEPVLRPKIGRLLNDKMPTGVAVTPAMNHGGPYPATGHPGFTAVGIPASLLRFGALYSYDNVRPDRLPLELKDKNPTGQMWRLINRQWSQGDVEG